MAVQGGEAVVQSKLSPELGRLVAAMAPDHEKLALAHREIDVLISTTRTVTGDDRALLDSLDVTVRTVAGNLLTARVPIDRLAELAEREVVNYVEISRPLAPEQARPSDGQSQAASEQP
ncbi:hypothetical protein [Amycolatopsis sp. WAC 04169]|uniref:hypothetical protein n=1 Tax=Amycolatopsis sp. WAC 04169 TaxID=2203197 RepID=UPI000F78BE2D|nr:hypothetical protein [Amycolatopsis sp. WAC 04169]